MKVLVAVAHPDDELLGAGPIIAKLKDQGHEVKVVIFTENSLRHGEEGASRASAIQASLMLGYSVVCWELEDQGLDVLRLAYLTSALEKDVGAYKPDLVLTHSSADLNRDHRVVSEVCRVVFRRYATLAEFQTISSSEFSVEPWSPNWMVALEEKHVDAAWEAFQTSYPKEVTPYPQARSKEAHKAIYAAYGASCSAPFAAALKVVTLRGII